MGRHASQKPRIQVNISEWDLIQVNLSKFKYRIVPNKRPGRLQNSNEKSLLFSFFN